MQGRNNLKFLTLLLGLVFCVFLENSSAQAQNYITVSSTTSTEQSGLFRHILPVFEKKTGISVRVVAVGTGQALDIGRRGDADVVFVHDKAAEEKFVAQGFANERIEIMYNDFVLLGPKADPAQIAGGKDIALALRKIAQIKTNFVSRGDKSGTHAAELRYWMAAGIDVSPQLKWYKETGTGMGSALNTASGFNAYILSDRATWLTFRNRGELTVLIQGDPKLFNQYGVMLVSSEKHPHTKRQSGQIFIDWLSSREGQDTIARFKVSGEPLFFPNAKNNPSSKRY